MKVKAVIGALFGDEGKGNTVQWLCKDALARDLNPVVVRFSGGSQAGHTVSDGKIKHICSSYGSGILMRVPTIIYDSNGSNGEYNHAYFDPIASYNEYVKFQEEYAHSYSGAIPILPAITVNETVRIITPYDMFYDRNDKFLLSDGTCGSGQWACHKRYENMPYSLRKYPSNPEEYIRNVRLYYGVEKDEEAEKAFVESFSFGHFKMEYNGDIKRSLKNIPNLCVILEGSQGLLLDADKGFYPNVTSTNVGVNATFDFIKNILDKKTSDCEYYFVMRTYVTRHGNGYEPISFPTEEDFKSFHDYECETNQDNCYQGVFKVGVMESSLISKAFSRHVLDNLQKKHGLKYNLVVTHFDKMVNIGYPKEYPIVLDGQTISKLKTNDCKTLFEKIKKAAGVNFETAYVSMSATSEDFENATLFL